MSGQFQRIGDTVFPGAKPEIPCGLYEWRGMLAEEIGEFAIRFICPEGAGQFRQFFVEPVAESWAKKDKKKRDESDAFLARACEVGYEVVAALNNHGPEQRQAYRLAAWLFRNRGVGHMAVTREFKAAADFFDFSNPKSPVLLLPGLGVNQTERRWTGTEAPGTARQLLAEAVGKLRERMASQGEELPEMTLNFSGILDLYDRLLSREVPPQATPTSLVYIDDQESQFILPLLGEAADFRRIEGTVADCLIYGPTEFAENLDVLAAYPEEREYLVRQLSQKLVEPGATPEKLGDWLAAVKNHGYLQLIEGGRNIEDEDDREEARELASQMMGAMTWCAYRMMGYCYGALMEIVAEDLEQNGRLSPLEGLIFRLEHCQIDLLAGLPLDFLGRAQFRWIVDKWQDLLVAMVRNYPLPGGQDASDAVSMATTRLKLFAYLLRERRDADRRTKEKENAEEKQKDRTSADSRGTQPKDKDNLDPRTIPPGRKPNRLDLEWLPEDHSLRNEPIRLPLENPATNVAHIVDETNVAHNVDDWENPIALEGMHADFAEPINLTSPFCPACDLKIQPVEIVEQTHERVLFRGSCGGSETVRHFVVDLKAIRPAATQR